MIRDYSNMAANERTFLAWVRTGVAIIALGFVIERFNLFLLTLAAEFDGKAGGVRFHGLASPMGRYGGIVLVGAGVLLIVVATIRFVQTGRMLARETEAAPRATNGTLVVLSALILGVAAFSAYLAIG
jgi:putative membrane protein